MWQGAQGVWPSHEECNSYNGRQLHSILPISPPEEYYDSITVYPNRLNEPARLVRKKALGDVEPCWFATVMKIRVILLELNSTQKMGSRLKINERASLSYVYST